MRRILYFFLGLIAFLSLLSSVAVSCVTNESLMKQGFLSYSQTEHLNVPASEYEQYAHLICRCLDGKQDFIQSVDPDTHETKDLFSEKENQHLRDVKALVTALKIARYAGGGAVIAALAALYFTAKDKSAAVSGAVRGFALSALMLLAAAAGLAVWGAVNFNGLFWTFHKIVFTNDLWHLDARTDLLAALMPLPFFSWFAGELLKALLPELGVMLLVFFAWLHIRNTQKKERKNP